MWKIKIGSTIKFAGEKFIVEYVWDNLYLGVTLRNGVYCEIPITHLEKRQ